jgi:hypothetical protein
LLEVVAVAITLAVVVEQAATEQALLRQLLDQLQCQLVTTETDQAMEVLV